MGQSVSARSVAYEKQPAGNKLAGGSEIGFAFLSYLCRVKQKNKNHAYKRRKDGSVRTSA